MAHGLPVLVSAERYCGISALLEHERNALVLEEPTDAAALARALDRLFKDQALCQVLSAAALTFAARYLWSEIAEQQQTIYYSLMDGQG